jgi:hypothetical protein
VEDHVSCREEGEFIEEVVDFEGGLVEGEDDGAALVAEGAEDVHDV